MIITLCDPPTCSPMSQKFIISYLLNSCTMKYMSLLKEQGDVQIDTIRSSQLLYISPFSPGEIWNERFLLPRSSL